MTRAKRPDPFALQRAGMNVPLQKVAGVSLCTKRCVLLVLIHHVPNGTLIAYPGHKRLADLTGLSVATVKRVLKSLRDDDHVLTWCRGKHRTNEYRLTIPDSSLVSSSTAHHELPTTSLTPEKEKV